MLGKNGIPILAKIFFRGDQQLGLPSYLGDYEIGTCVECVRETLV
jgi:hypothetical protein